MTKADKLELSTLSNDVREALRQWHGDANTPSPLRHLYLFRKIQHEGHDSVRRVTNQLLDKAIKVLKHSHDADAQFLQLRFQDLWPIHRLAHHFQVAESTVYTLQRQAIERLTETLLQMELDARMVQKARLDQRLPSASYVNLIGVESHLSHLRDVLSTQGPPWVVSIEGMGGIGKTSLADALARLLSQVGAFDEVGWVSAQPIRLNLDGVLTPVEGATLTTESLIEKLTQQLMPEFTHQADHSTERLWTMLQAQFKAFPHLIVIDSLETLVDVESLLPTLQTLSNPSKFLLTSRESLRTTPNIYHVAVAELNKENALRLIRQEAEVSNLPTLVACADEELVPILETVGGNPLALRLVVGQTHLYTLESILADLRAAHGQTVQNLYTFIYRRIWDKLEPMSQQVLLAMPLVQLSGGSLEYIAQVGDLDIGQVRMALNQLIQLNLVDARGGLHERYYSIHSLTRTFLQEQVAKWKGTNPSATFLAQQFREYVIRSTKIILDRLDTDAFLDELQHQALHILNSIFQLSDAWLETRSLLSALIPKMANTEHLDDWLPYLEKGIKQSQLMNDVAMQASLSTELGQLHQQSGRFDKALSYFTNSTKCYASLQDQLNQARSICYEAFMLYLLQQYKETVNLIEQALALLGNDDPERTNAYQLLGWVALEQNDWQKVLHYFESSLAVAPVHIQVAVEQRLVEVAARFRMPNEYAQAIVYHEQAIVLYNEKYDILRQAVARLHLGTLYLQQNQSTRALEYYILAEQFFRQIDDNFHLAVVVRNQGSAYKQMQQWDQAETCYLASLKLWQQLEIADSLIEIVDELKLFYLARGEYAKAVDVFEDVRQNLAELGYESADEIRFHHNHPLCINAKRFFERAGFELELLSALLLYRCKTTQASKLKYLLPTSIYIRFLPGETLDDDQVLLIRQQVRVIDPKAMIVFAVTDQRPTDQGWTQIGTLRMSGFTVLPMEAACINNAIANENEFIQLKLELENRLGGNYDPYDITSPVSSVFSFFGREAQVETLLRDMAKGQPIGIFGLRKLGKSSLLQVLRDRAPFPVALLNSGTIGVEEELFELYTRILDEWKKRIRVRYGHNWEAPIINPNSPKADFIKAANSLLQFMTHQTQDEPRIGIFLDEIESITPESPHNNFIPESINKDFKLMRYIELFGTLRGLIDQSTPLSLVVAGRDPTLNRINYLRGTEQNPLFGFFSQVNLPLLTKESCIQMITNLGRQVDLLFSVTSLDLIYHLSGGHPFLARQLCSVIYNSRNRRNGKVNATEVTAAAKRYIYTDSKVEHIDGGIWQDAGNRALWGDIGAHANQRLLLDLARAEMPIAERELLNLDNGDARVAALYNLEYYHFVKQKAGDYSIRFGLLKTWLRQRKLGLGASYGTD